jgi:hypothetical protein
MGVKPSASPKDPCEWNPFAHRAAFTDEAFGCQNQAELIVGANGEWRLCRRCWEQDRARHFARFRVVREIEAS